MPNRVLVVDDNATERHGIMSILEASDPLLELYEASDGIEALKLLAERPIDLVIADLVMPKMDGIKLLSAIRLEDRFEHMPVIVATSRAEIQEKLLVFKHGAQDYLIKPFHPLELVARTRVMLSLREQMRALKEQAIIDTLTGLYNQNYLASALHRELKRSQRHELNLSCLMIDVDDFKMINDTQGHLAGDEVLRTLGRLIQSTVRGYDFAVRYGGDEFLMVLAQNSPSGAYTVAERIREMVACYMFFPRHSPPNPVRVSIGVASVPGQSIKTADAVIRAADQALYQAKTQGKNQVLTTETLSVEHL